MEAEAPETAAPQPVTVGRLARDFVSYYKAIFARTLFGSHAVVTVWRTTVLMGVEYWALCFGVVCLCAEYIVTMWANMGEEWPWISPSTLCYLATVSSSLWVQKLQSLGHVTGTNGSTLATVPSTSMELDFSPADWLLLTEQTMMVTIILSRWLLPKGEMSHTGLSSLLLLYLGLSADILDFSTIFNEPKVAADKTFCYILLVVWTGSLFQFFLVLTNTKKADDEKISLKSIACSSEVWQILVQVGLQDLPFLIIRLTVMLNYQVFNYTIIFFVCKNTLVIALEVNHIIGLCAEQREKLRRRQAKIQGIKKKLTSAKDKIAMATKNPFTMNKIRELGKKNGATGGGNAFTLAAAALSSNKAEDEQNANEENKTNLSNLVKTGKELLRKNSRLSGSSDDGYATAAEGSSSRPASLEPFDEIIIEHASEGQNVPGSTSVENTVQPSSALGNNTKEKDTKTTVSSTSGTLTKNKTAPTPRRFPGFERLKNAAKPRNFQTEKKTTNFVNTSGAAGTDKDAKKTSPNRKDSGDNLRRGTPPLGHFVASDSSFSLRKINTTDSSAFSQERW